VASGLAEGNLYFLGDFDECLEMSVKVNGVQGINDISGQYCILDLPKQTLLDNQTNRKFVSILYLAQNLIIYMNINTKKMLNS